MSDRTGRRGEHPEYVVEQAKLLVQATGRDITPVTGD